MNQSNSVQSRRSLWIPALVVVGLFATTFFLFQPTSGTATVSVEEPTDPNLSHAIFAGGCFWCTEADFEKVPGVKSAVSGYIGGEQENPTYRQVSSGGTGHTEAVRIAFDPAEVSYEELVEIFWRTIDPTVKNRQFCDYGSQYRSGIFYLDSGQQAIAEASLEGLKTSKPFPEPIVTEITAASTFYVAEEYHQDFYKKNPDRYYSYRRGCGRDTRLQELWGEK